jgi:hypothetical protein
MRQGSIWTLAAASVLFAQGSVCGQTPYSYSLIATTGGTSSLFAIFAPSINFNGTASFGAVLNGGGAGVFSGNGGVVSTIAQTGPFFSGFNFPPGPIVASISPTTTTTTFFGARTPAAGGGVGIFHSSGGPPVTIAGTGGVSPFTNFGIAPDINAANVVAFQGNVVGGGQGIFIGDGAATQTIATTGLVFAGFNGAVAVNNFNTVSFAAAGTGGGSGIFRGTTTSTISIAATGPVFTGFAGPTDINDNGQVAFVASRTAGGTGVFRGDGTTIDIAALSGASYQSFGEFVSVAPNGGVVFAANLVGGGQGIFTGPDPVLNRVIRTGDALEGSTVVNVALASGAINGVGQIAFFASLANGRQAVFIATPVPEPTGILAIGAACCSLWALRRKGRKRIVE